jgi:membrane dipeptidase
MLMIDSHLDLAWNALQWERDLTASAYTIRAQEAGTPGVGRAQGTVALPDLRRGRVAVCFGTTLARATGRPTPGIDYRSPLQTYAVAQGQIAYYRALEQAGHARIIRTRAALDAHMAEWRRWDAATPAGEEGAPPLGLVISMESADPILRPADLAEWYAAGVRVIGPTHYGPGRYAGGTATELGLTDIGAELLAEMQRLGVTLDLTHCSDEAFWQALERYDGPVLASHNNCRALVPHQRQFSDAQLRAIIARDGVVGAAFDIWMLDARWSRGQSNERARIASAVDHIDHICQLSGTSRHAGIGSDLDGGFGREQSPLDLDTIADLQRLADLLAQRGYSEPDVANIMHGNWARLLGEVLRDE